MMDIPEGILAGVALLVGVRSAWWNPTAGALVASWAFGFVMLHVFGIWLTRDQLVYCDWAVIAFIAGKPATCDLRPYKGLIHWLRCRFLERSKYDVCIVGLFLPAWIVYATPLSDFVFYWSLWTIAVLQFVIAGAEAFYKRREYRMTNAAAPELPSAGLEFSRPAWGGGYG